MVFLEKVTHTTVYGCAGEGANMDKGRTLHTQLQMQRVSFDVSDCNKAIVKSCMRYQGEWLIYPNMRRCTMCTATNCMQGKVKEKKGEKKKDRTCPNCKMQNKVNQ